MFPVSAFSRYVFSPGRCRAAQICCYSNTSTALPESARVVICGAGVQGIAIAYYLSKLGWGNDTLVIDQGELGGGPTWHMSGLVGAYKPTWAETRITQETIRLYKELTEGGHSTGWKQCGSLLLARTRDRMTHFRRLKDHAPVREIQCSLLSPADIAKKYPYLNTSDLYGGLWIPEDGVADPYKVCHSLAKLATDNGVQVREKVQVGRVLAENFRVSAVETDRGKINCEYFVNCGGFWAHALGKKSVPIVRVPVHAVEHYYLHTKPVEGIDQDMPVIRDVDGHVYIRVRNGCYVGGGFEPNARPVYEDGLLPSSSAESVLETDWDHFAPLLEQMLFRVPSVREANLGKLCNGPEAFSPDCKWLIGESSEIANYFIATGMKSVGTASAGGIGKLIAEWIANKKPPNFSFYELDIQRFAPLHNNRQFLLERMREVPSVHYNLQYPFSEFRTGRKLRTSAVFQRTKAAGAVFSQTMGYERPAYFEPQPYQDSGTFDQNSNESDAPYRVAYTNSFMKPHWFTNVRNEYRACREGVAIADYSSFTKLELSSSTCEIVDYLQELCSNDVDIPLGGIIHTGMHNERGGYENDCSLIRTSENSYMMIAPGIQQVRSQTWLKRHLPANSNIKIADVTSLYTALCVMGPLSRPLLTELSDADLSPKNFPFFTMKEIDIGQACGIRAMNLTHTGELGWTLYIPNEVAVHVYDRIIECGQKYSIQHAGYYATKSLRAERFYAYWGQDIDAAITPLECGRAFRVKFDSDINFIGKSALQEQRQSGVTRMYAQLILEDHDPEVDPWPWGGEPIYRNGELVGLVTTAAFGYTLNRQVCLGYVTNPDEKRRFQKVTPEFVTSGQYEIDIAGLRFSAKVSLRSPNLPTRFRDDYGEHYVATRHGGGSFA